MSRNDGAIQLARSGKTHEEIAQAVGVTRVAVGHWIAGTRKPRKEARNRLLELFGVAVDAWDRLKSRGSPFKASGHDVVAGGVASAVTSGVTSVTSLVASPVVPEGVIAKAVELERMAHDLMKKLHDDEIATPLEQAKVMASVSSTLTHLAKLTGQYDLGRRLFRLPVWARIRRALADGLADFPDAAKSVEVHLRRAEDEFELG